MKVMEMKAIDKSAVKIRRLTSSDITSTLGIWWASIPEKEVMVAQLQSPLDLSFIAEYEGILIGFILAQLEYAGLPTIGTGVVFLLAVNPDYQKHGIGTMLIDALERYAMYKGIKTIRVVVPQSDIKNIRYFTKVGFSKSVMINYDKVCQNR
jgi:ribosomal protein S18 acetylase RimI-like enzyme